MRRGTPNDLEAILRVIAFAGATVLGVAIAVAGFGAITRTLAPAYDTTLRFLVAVLVVTAPYAELIERRSRAIRRIPTDERLGFAPGRPI